MLLLGPQGLSGRCTGRRPRPVVQIMGCVVTHAALREFHHDVLRMGRTMAALAFRQRAVTLFMTTRAHHFFVLRSRGAQEIFGRLMAGGAVG